MKYLPDLFCKFTHCSGISGYVGNVSAKNRSANDVFQCIYYSNSAHSRLTFPIIPPKKKILWYRHFAIPHHQRLFYSQFLVDAVYIKIMFSGQIPETSKMLKKSLAINSISV